MAAAEPKAVVDREPAKAPGPSLATQVRKLHDALSRGNFNAQVKPNVQLNPLLPPVDDPVLEKDFRSIGHGRVPFLQYVEYTHILKKLFGDHVDDQERRLKHHNKGLISFQIKEIELSPKLRKLAKKNPDSVATIRLHVVIDLPLNLTGDLAAMDTKRFCGVIMNFKFNEKDAVVIRDVLSSQPEAILEALNNQSEPFFQQVHSSLIRPFANVQELYPVCDLNNPDSVRAVRSEMDQAAMPNAKSQAFREKTTDAPGQSI